MTVAVGTEAPGTGENNTPDPNADPNNSTEPKTPETPAGPPAGETAEQKATRLEAEVARLNREKEDVRVQKKGEIADTATKKAVAALAKAVGIELPGGEELTVETLTEKLNEQTGKTAEATKEANATKIELAVYKSATPKGIDVDRLTDLKSFDTATKDLDPADPSFEAKLTAAIDAAVKKDPSLKGRPGGGSQRSGAENFSGSGDSKPITKEDFAKMSIEDKTALFRSNRAEFDRLSA